MTEQPQPIVSTLRVRIGQEEAHYGGNLVEGARVLKFFGDIVTEVAIITDGDEGLFVGYDKVEFLAPVHTGDFLEITGTVTRIGTTSRTVQPEAREVIASRYDENPSGPAPPRGAAAPPRGGRGAGEGRTDDTRLRSPGRH